MFRRWLAVLVMDLLLNDGWEQDDFGEGVEYLFFGWDWRMKQEVTNRRQTLFLSIDLLRRSLLSTVLSAHPIHLLNPPVKSLPCPSNMPDGLPEFTGLFGRHCIHCPEEAQIDDSPFWQLMHLLSLPG